MRNRKGRSSHRADLTVVLRMPRSALRPGSLLVLVLLVAAPRLGAQLAPRAEPLRKTDLIRLLSGRTMTQQEIAALVGRNCLSFTPTVRDRRNLTALGADSGVMGSIDACLQGAGRGRTPPAEPPRPPGLVAVPLATRISVMAGGTASVAVSLRRGGQAVGGARLVLRGSRRSGDGGRGTAGEGPARSDVEAVTDGRGIARFRVPAPGEAGSTTLAVATATGEPLAGPATIELVTVAPAPPPRPERWPAASRTGFVLGTGQRGRVGEPAPLPVVFEVRDSAGAPMGDVTVALAVTNGRLGGGGDAEEARTDSLGQVRAAVVFGERAGVPTVVSGTVGAIRREATLAPEAAPPSRLVVLADGNALTGQLVVLAARPAVLRVYARDRFGNPVPLVGLRATVGDDHVVRVTDVTPDSAGGSITIAAVGGGSTNLVVEGSGLRTDFSALVRP